MINKYRTYINVPICILSTTQLIIWFPNITWSMRPWPLNLEINLQFLLPLIILAIIRMRGFSMYHTNINLPIMKWIFDIDLRKLWCPKYYSRYTKACKLMIIHVHVLPHTLCNFISFLEMLTLRQACCAVRIVPPPTVPTSIHGMVQLMYRSSWVGPVASIRVIQLLLATHWAGSCNITNMSVNHTSKAEINLFL